MPVRKPSTAVLRRLVTSPILVLGLIAAVMVPASALGVQRYHDVDPTHRFADAIGWATSEGLTDGCKSAPDAEDLELLSAAEAELPGFCPGAPVTRAQLMEVLYRYDQTVVGQPGPAGPAGPQGPAGPSGAAGASACSPLTAAEVWAATGSYFLNAKDVRGPASFLTDEVLAAAPTDIVFACSDVVSGAQSGCLSFVHIAAAVGLDDQYIGMNSGFIFLYGAPACLEVLGLAVLDDQTLFLP